MHEVTSATGERHSLSATLQLSSFSSSLHEAYTRKSLWGECPLTILPHLRNCWTDENFHNRCRILKRFLSFLLFFNGLELLFNFSSVLPYPETVLCLRASEPNAVGMYHISPELLTDLLPLFDVFSH